MWVATVVIIVSLAWWIASSRLFANERKKAESELSALPEFNANISDVFFDSSALAIDSARGKIAIIEVNFGQRNLSVFGYSDIVAVEVCRDGRSITKTNRGSQIAGAAVGAVLLGPVGLLIGGLTGSKRVDEKISTLSLKIYTNDIENPVREVTIFSQIPAMKADYVKKVHGPKAEEWYGRLRAIVELN